MITKETLLERYFDNLANVNVRYHYAVKNGFTVEYKGDRVGGLLKDDSGLFVLVEGNFVRWAEFDMLRVSVYETKSVDLTQ